MKKILAILLAICLIFSLGACAEGENNSTTAPADPTTGTTAPTSGENTDPNPTDPSAPTEDVVPSEPPVTNPSEPTSGIPDASEPTDFPAPTEPTVSESTGTALPDTEQPTEPDVTAPQPTTPSVTLPSRPTEPIATTPQASQPRPSQPIVIDPPVTVPPVTDPAPTTPRPVQCNHNYTLTATQAATCTAPMVETYTCTKCGDAYQQTAGEPLAHAFRDATCYQPRICMDCGAVSGSALGHLYNTRAYCTRCGETEPGPIEITVSVRDTKGNNLANVTVSIFIGGSDRPIGTVVTGNDGLAYIEMDQLSTYQVVLSNLPPNIKANSSYTFSSKRANINLETQPVLDPLDHSLAEYKKGSTMADFTLTDTDGNIYNLYELLEEKELVILDFWYCSCAPCKKEFPYFEEALNRYGDQISLLALNPLDSLDSIVALREELGSTFPMLRDTVNLFRGFDVTAYPATVFIDSDGKILSIHRGAFSDQEQFLNQIERYLK